jgi:proteic killer suppression protein
MIKSFIHKGLKKFYTTGNASGINSLHQNKLRMQLTALNSATVINDLDLPGFKLHKLVGNRKNIYAISVNKNWRLTFEFKDSDVYILNYEDYH